MGINRFGFDSMTLTCDECGEDMAGTFDETEFQDMINEAKHKGWKIKKVGSDWEHYCPLHANPPAQKEFEW